MIEQLTGVCEFLVLGKYMIFDYHVVRQFFHASSNASTHSGIFFLEVINDEFTQNHSARPRNWKVVQYQNNKINVKSY